ncbi:uncharacterized protein LOC113675531 [Pocillopora damicornis]|uniref:uncharacterized protein LOC113675531 n=1 Tax=Pocillopora damicornis TaxID=46731 RepID=UPI000F558528|nr:uncharacterized protein LOC113675531 [Pocillopora damicornis]
MSRSRPENFQQRKMFVYAEKLPDLRWKRITKSWIDSALTGGVTLTYDEENNGLTISGRVTSSGCGSAPPSGALTLIKGCWTMIKYTQEFRGRSSCWSIFGDEWYGGLYISNTSTGLYPFNAKAGDVITDEYRMGLNSHAFDGKTRRCDKLATNFWRSQKGLRRATVVLRRKPMAEKAGIFTGTSCGTPTYKIRDIYVYF